MKPKPRHPLIPHLAASQPDFSWSFDARRRIGNWQTVSSSYPARKSDAEHCLGGSGLSADVFPDGHRGKAMEESCCLPQWRSSSRSSIRQVGLAFQCGHPRSQDHEAKHHCQQFGFIPLPSNENRVWVWRGPEPCLANGYGKTLDPRG